MTAAAKKELALIDSGRLTGDSDRLYAEVGVGMRHLLEAYGAPVRRRIGPRRRKRRRSAAEGRRRRPEGDESALKTSKMPKRQVFLHIVQISGKASDLSQQSNAASITNYPQDMTTTSLQRKKSPPVQSARCDNHNVTGTRLLDLRKGRCPKVGLQNLLLLLPLEWVLKPRRGRS